ncbi:hypothetical protein [Streptomyces sp. NPDC048669]|uniref:hypothetical protein n=1 Tax=Streptomyces sp. NPDC048669 TaxID=3155267 RepID=UPI00341233EF
MTGWLTRHPNALTEEDRAGLKGVLTRCPELATASGHVRDFGEIFSDRLGSTPPGWIEGAVNRIKKIKRQLYGRAGLELLHKMILLQ